MPTARRRTRPPDRRPGWRRASFFAASWGKILRRGHVSAGTAPASAAYVGIGGLGNRATAVGVRPTRRNRGGVAGILMRHHHPPAPLLFELIAHDHTLARGNSFWRKRYRGIRRVAIELDGSHLHVHRADTQILAARQIVEHSFADRIFTCLSPAMAAGKGQDEKQERTNSHSSIILGHRSNFAPSHPPHARRPAPRAAAQSPSRTKVPGRDSARGSVGIPGFGALLRRGMDRVHLEGGSRDQGCRKDRPNEASR